MNMPAPEKKELYYGWKVVFALLVLLTFSTGLSFYNHAVILNALAQQPAFTVQSASLAISLFFLSGGITGLFVARWIAVVDPRVCITTGAIACSVALTALSFVHQLWQLYIVYILFGMGFSATGLIPATTLVTRWFHEKRARALSIASTGLSLGGVAITPFCAILVESIGLERAAPLMGAAFLIGVIPVAWIWLRPHPASMGLTALGFVKTPLAEIAHNALSGITASATTMPTQATVEGILFREARGGKFFWAVSLSYIFLMLAQVAGIAHQYGLIRESLSEAQTAMVVAIIPITSITGRLIGGWIVDFVSIRAFAISMMVLQVASLLMLATGLGVVGLCIGLALFGTTVGNLLMMQPLLIVEAYGVKDYARIFSVSNLMTSLGPASGPALLGLVYAASDEQYRIPYMVAAAAGLLGLLIFITGGDVKQKKD